MTTHEGDLRRRIGQLFVCGFAGPEPDEAVRRLIADHAVGGIIYFRRNLHDPLQALCLSRRLQELNREHSDTPLLIATDQEGGMVTRLDEGMSPMPGNMALGATGGAQLAYRAARVSGEELRLLGINANFAPCLDVNNNPRNPVIGVRSYGEDPDRVAAMGAAAIRGYQEAGIAACAKHFPGHGDTDLDSHLALPGVPHAKERLEAVELVPFRKAVEAGVDMIMTAHVRFPAFEPDNIPATLSKRVLTGLLREELGFAGVIVTDCLEMNAISRTCGVGEGAVRAVEAGADLLLVSHEPERQLAALEAIHAAVRSGRLSEERIERSVARVLKMKEARKMADIAPAGETASLSERLNRPEARQLALNISRQSVTLVKDEGQLPLSQRKTTLVIWTERRAGTEVDEAVSRETTLGRALSAHIEAVEEMRVGVSPSEEEIEEAVAKSAAYGQVVIATYNASSSQEQQELVRRIAARRPDVVAVATREPYDLLHFPDVRTYLACYENRPAAMETAADILLGLRQARGRLPVTLPGLTLPPA